MKRYAAFDPPEYVDWSPDPDVMAEYRATVERWPERRETIEALGPDRLLSLYEGLLRFRLHDIALKRWVRQGVISKAWLGTGEEATTIGAVHALDRDGDDGDVVGPMIRNAGACHEMGMPVADMLRAYLATDDSPNRGRDLHIASLRHGVAGPISMVGALAPVIVGHALAFKMRGQPRVALTWIGDGATKHGEVHEALNFAAVHRLPAIFVIQNNQVALGTDLRQHHAAEDFSDWGRMYGCACAGFDGNHVLDAYATTRWAADRCRSGEGPVILTAETFRMGGHATHDEREARELFEPEVFRRWGLRDPIGCYEEWLAGSAWNLDAGEPVEPGGAEQENRRVLAGVEDRVTDEVEAAAEDALRSRGEAMPDPESALEGVYREPPDPPTRWPAPFY
jgi:TPP-dependent pyruvate/acetoin dehydrogenase alpha subunit